MTLQQLKYVSMVEKCGSFSRAAQKLYVSQPSISNLVNALEEELGHIIYTSPLTQYNGALGAALFAYQRYQKEQKG